MSNYYVATNGNDGYPGTIGQPWATLTYAATQLVAGDNLFLRGGTYTGAGINVNFAVDGTAESRITIDNYLDEVVILDAQDTYPAASVYYFLVTLAGDYNTIRDITIHDSRGSGLNLAGDYCYAYNITGIDSREAGLLLSGTGDLADGCTWTNCGNGYGVDGQTTWGSGIGTTGTSCTIQNCISHTNIGEGFNPGGTALNCIVQDCVTYNNDSANLYLDSGTGTIVRRNLVYDTTVSPASGIVIGAEASQPSSLTIENNLVMGCFMNFHVDSNVTQLVNVKVQYNTFVNAIGDLAGYDMGVYVRAVTTYTNSIFKNNIVIEEDAGRRPVTCLDASHAGLVFDYNCYNKAVDAEETGANDVVGDPKIAKAGLTTAGNLSAAYFQLNADSPCIDAALDIFVHEDYQRNVRPQGDGYDMGACERQPLIQLRHTTIVE